MINKIAVYGGPRLRTAISTRHTWIRRFPWCGSLRKLHGHCVVTDGVFNSATAGGGVFRAATGIDANTIAQVPAQLRRHLWRSFVRCGLVPGDAAQPMAQWEHDGDFSVDASVCNDAIDGAGCLRLLRYDRRRSPGGIAPSHRSPWNGCASSIPNVCAMRAPSPVRAGGPLLPTPLERIDRLARPGAAATHTPPSPLRCAHANGR